MKKCTHKLHTKISETMSVLNSWVYINSKATSTSTLGPTGLTTLNQIQKHWNKRNYKHVHVFKSLTSGKKWIELAKKLSDLFLQLQSPQTSKGVIIRHPSSVHVSSNNDRSSEKYTDILCLYVFHMDLITWFLKKKIGRPSQWVSPYFRDTRCYLPAKALAWHDPAVAPPLNRRSLLLMEEIPNNHLDVRNPVKNIIIYIYTISTGVGFLPSRVVGGWAPHLYISIYCS